MTSFQHFMSLLTKKVGGNSLMKMKSTKTRKLEIQLLIDNKNN